jgi:pyruvate/2-oxoglutarate dehydrogenase complex dihydrolipoamide acyltransferase (E2) component
MDAAHTSEFQVFAYAVALAVREHPRFRSSLVGPDTLREWPHVHLGVAVAQPDDELVTAVVPDADAFGLEAFLGTLFSRLRRARRGEDQADSRTNVLLSYMGGYDVLNAVPVLVAPAAAVLFIGTPFERETGVCVNLSLTFDHRWINGVGAAKFLRTVDRRLTDLTDSSNGVAGEGTCQHENAGQNTGT